MAFPGAGGLASGRCAATGVAGAGVATGAVAARPTAHEDHDPDQRYQDESKDR